MILWQPMLWTKIVLAVIAPEGKVDFNAAGRALRRLNPLAEANIVCSYF
jgi:hypothetical protein